MESPAPHQSDTDPSPRALTESERIALLEGHILQLWAALRLQQSFIATICVTQEARMQALLEQVGTSDKPATLSHFGHTVQ